MGSFLSFRLLSIVFESGCSRKVCLLPWTYQSLRAKSASSDKTDFGLVKSSVKANLKTVYFLEQLGTRTVLFCSTSPNSSYV